MLGLVYRLAKLGLRRIVKNKKEKKKELLRCQPRKVGGIWLFHLLLKNQKIW